MSSKEKKMLQRLIIAGILFIIAMVMSRLELVPEIVYFIFFLASYLVVGGKVLLKAIRNIRKGQVFDENFLMAVATIGAFCLREYGEGVAVMLFYQVGELFESYAVSKSRRSISDLMDIRPDYANVVRDGVLVQVDPEEVNIGDQIVVKPGERIPVDGIIEEGNSSIDTSALTGESVPRDTEKGDSVISGCINQTGKLTISVTKEYADSTVSKILELVENASDKKSKSENFITRFARYYTPIVVFAALALAIIPPLLTGDPFSMWIERALTFLVVSCPCALVISVPLSFFGGIGGASKSGVLVKGSNYLELLATTEIVVFDKTGTLTKGNFVVSQIHTNGIDEQELLELASYVEDASNHPIAKSIQKAYGKPIDTTKIQDIEEIAGHGIRAKINGQEMLAGNEKLMKKYNIDYQKEDSAGTIVYCARNHEFLGSIVIEDQIKADSAVAISELKQLGVKETVMLTGDSKAVGERVAKELKIDQVYTELLPGDKVDQMEKLLHSKSAKGNLAFVGDGINDAPVLARADIGIAMGGLGSDAAIEAADVVIMNDEPSKISVVIQIARKTLGIAKQNIVFALGIKAIVLILAVFGYASMWAAVFADVGVSVIAILNAMRALNTKEIENKKVEAKVKNEIV